MWGGISITLTQGWQKFGDNFYTLRHKDWRDRAGTRDHIDGDDIFKVLGGRLKPRGVVVLDHEPSTEERERLERESRETNEAYRMGVVSSYEHRIREREITGQGNPRPSPYEDECYTKLGLTKPYSVEAMRAQRHPGEAAAREFRDAMVELLAERREAERKPDAKEATPDTPAVRSA
jgi:hypothetical protein